MENSKLRSLHDRIIVLPDAVETLSDGGIVIPDTVTNPQSKSIVICVGPGTKDKPMEAKKGDHIIHSKFSGTEIIFDNKLYLVMREDEILAVID